MMLPARPSPRKWAGGIRAALPSVRDDFVPGSSDYDFQVEFEVGFDVGPWARHLFELARDLEALLGAKVDVGQALPITNPHLRETIEGERVLVYESS